MRNDRGANMTNGTKQIIKTLLCKLLLFTVQTYESNAI